MRLWAAKPRLIKVAECLGSISRQYYLPGSEWEASQQHTASSLGCTHCQEGRSLLALKVFEPFSIFLITAALPILAHSALTACCWVTAGL